MNAPRPPRSALWFGTLLLVGCGDGTDGPALPTGKLPPTLTREQAGRTYDGWLVRADSKDPALAGEALWALVELAQDPSALVPRVRAALAATDPNLRHAGAVAADRLLARGEQALVPDLVARLDDAERRVVQIAQAALVRHGEHATGALASALADPDEGRAAAAARTLRVIGPRASGVAGALVRAALRGGLALHLDAMKALDALGTTALPAVGDALPDARGEHAQALVAWVGARGAAAAPLAPRLVERLVAPAAAEDAALVQALEDALVAIGPDALPALEAAAAQPAAARVLERVRPR